VCSSRLSLTKDSPSFAMASDGNPFALDPNARRYILATTASLLICPFS
jgi:hypothetical protein